MPAQRRPQLWTPADRSPLFHAVAAAADPALTTDRMTAATRPQIDDHSVEADWEADVAWAAGLLSIASSDEDVIDRFRSVVGTGRLGSQAPGRNNREKRPWRVDVIHVDDVLRITRMLYPWLGSRRRARADEAVAVLEERIETAAAERICPNCGESFRPPFTPNAARTKYCSRQCERRYHWRLRWQRAREAAQ